MPDRCKPIVYLPPPERLKDILYHLHRFLLAANECRCVLKSQLEPTAVQLPHDSRNDMEVHSSLYDLEIALNPQRLAFHDNRRMSLAAVGWPNIMRFARLLRTLREQVDSTLKDWGWESLCASTSLCLSVAGIAGPNTAAGSFSPGTAVLQMPYGWRPWVQQSIVDDLTQVRDAFLEYLHWHATQHSQNPESEIDELVTLSQVAPLTGHTKRTLERYLNDEKLPQPDVRGGDGKANKWYWSTIRPPLQKMSGRLLPERFPGSQIL